MPYATVRIPIEIITPVWTGNADGKTSYIKGSSIVGGLRFWSEALLRSLGHRVCDITGNDKDIYNPEGENLPICKACEIFGCTGKGRSFALRVIGELHPGKPIGVIELPKREDGKAPSWYLKDPGMAGKFDLEIAPLRPGGIDPMLALAIATMLEWGTLGARDQYGQGIIKAAISEELKAMAQQAIPAIAKAPEAGLSLRNFFFFKAEVKDNKKEVPFEIRNKVRNGLRSGTNATPLRHYFCGSLSRDKKRATRFNIGKLAPNQVIGWGHYPLNGEFDSQRDHCLHLLKNTLLEFTKNSESLQWREFQSPRDTENQNRNWPEFLKMLLEGGWK